jgi:membrane protease YdiL (CAAX protease family)
MATGKSDPQGGAPAALSWRLVLLFYGAMLGLALIWRFAVDGVIPWREAPTEVVLPLAWRIGAGLGAGLAVVGASRLWTVRSAAGRAVAAELGRLIGPVSAPRAWLLALSSGLAEEAFFRGALQPRVGWLAATVLFAALHFVPTRQLRSWALFALVAGGLFGALFAATGDLLAPALAHIVVNGLNLRWLGSRHA